MNLQQTTDWIVANPEYRLGQVDAAFGGRSDSHHVWPSGENGPNVPANRVRCDPDFHRAAHTYLSLLAHFGGKVPWTIARHFAGARKGVPGIREIALLGYDRLTRQAM